MIKSKGYTGEQIEAIIAEYKQSGDPITVFCKKRDHKPSYQTLKGWLDAAGVLPTGKVTTTATPATSVPSTPEAIKAEIERLQGAYKASLQSRVDSLRADIDRMQEELAAAELELKEYSAETR